MKGATKTSKAARLGAALPELLTEHERDPVPIHNSTQILQTFQLEFCEELKRLVIDLYREAQAVPSNCQVIN